MLLVKGYLRYWAETVFTLRAPVTLTFDLLTPKSIGFFYSIKAITLWSLNALVQTVLQLLRGNQVWQTDRWTDGQGKIMSPPEGGGEDIINLRLMKSNQPIKQGFILWRHSQLRNQKPNSRWLLWKMDGGHLIFVAVLNFPRNLLLIRSIQSTKDGFNH